MGERWLRVPIGEDADRGSMPFGKTVLALVRTFNTTVRLLDVLPELFEDNRVQVLFSLSDERSCFDDGTIDLVRAAGGRIVPWKQALATEFDLIVGASFTGGFKQLRGPQMIISHGTGIAKTTAIPPGGEVEVSEALGSADATVSPRTVNVISHSFELEIFAADQPDGVSFLVAGDPCFDRLEASLASLERYRRATGIPAGTKLVTVSSTWGKHSLLYRNPELLTRMVAELPVDEFRVAMVLHPNIWFAHGSWQVRTWFRRALESGLILVTPQDAWRGALVAADLVVGDHGAVTFYGAALGRPVLLAADGDDEVARGTPTERFMRAAPKLDSTKPLAPQVEAALRDHRADRYDELVDDMFEYRGEALERIGAAAYRLLGLERPAARPRVLAVDPPVVERASVLSYRVFARHDRAQIRIWRHPAALEAPTPPPPPRTFITSWPRRPSRTPDFEKVPRSSSETEARDRKGRKPGPTGPCAPTPGRGLRRSWSTIAHWRSSRDTETRP